MTTRTSALTALAAGALLAGGALTGVAAAAPNGASFTTAMPSEATFSRIAGTQIALMTPSFDLGVPIYGGGGVPASPTIIGSAQAYGRSVRAGGITDATTFMAVHRTPAQARARVLQRLVSDKGTDVSNPGIGSLSRSYDTPSGSTVVRVAVGIVSLGAQVAGTGTSDAVRHRVAEGLARQVARRATAATTAEPPAVPAFLNAMVPPAPVGWASSGTVASGFSSVAVDSAPGSAALKTKGWGTFQNVMGLGQATGTTQVAVTNMNTVPSSPSGLSAAVTGIPFGSPDAARSMARALPGIVSKGTTVAITVPGAVDAVAVRGNSGYGVSARISSPRGDLLEVGCYAQAYRKVDTARCTAAISAIAQGWLAVAPR